MSGRDGVWTDEALVAELQRLWSEGLSTQAIARRLGTTKNAVVGKAHRMALPPRENPVKHRPAPEPEVAPIVEAPAPLARGCLYPMWANSAKPDQTFCGEPRKSLSPYCQDHHDLTHNGRLAMIPVEVKKIVEAGFKKRRAA